MSYITDVVIVLDWISPENEAILTAPMPFDTDRHQSLRRIETEGAGGVKVFCSNIYAGAFNYLPEEFEGWVIEVLARAANAAVWMSTEGHNVQVFRPDGIVRGAIEPD